MPDTYVEIARFHHAQPLEDCEHVLKKEGIPFRLSNEAPAQSLAAYQLSSPSTSIVSVPREQYGIARLALLNAAREQVAADGVEEGHYLSTCDDKTLLEVLHSPAESSGYDLAVAETLLRKRGQPVPEIPFEVIDASATLAANDGERLPTLPGLRRGSRIVLSFGFILGTIGGVLGLIMGLNFALATETVPGTKQSRYVYDESTRGIAAVLALYSVIMIFGWIGFRLARSIG